MVCWLYRIQTSFYRTGLWINLQEDIRERHELTDKEIIGNLLIPNNNYQAGFEYVGFAF